MKGNKQAVRLGSKQTVEKLHLVCPLVMKASPSGRKLYKMNFNEVKGLHYQVYNNLKKHYKETMREQIEGFKLEPPVQVVYRLYKGSRRKTDKMNFVSIGSKFVLDALSELGAIPDDNDEIIHQEVLLPTRLDRDNPRLEVLIKTIK